MTACRLPSGPSHIALLITIIIILQQCLVSKVHCYLLTGCCDITKVYPEKPAFFGLLTNPQATSNGRRALDHVSANFSEGVTAFIGASKAGKSTLAKVCLGLEPYDSGRLLTHHPNVNSSHSCGYLDHHFYLTYTSTRLVASILEGQEATLNPRGQHLVGLAADLLELPRGIPVDQLLESQRRCFEIVLALSRLPYLSKQSRSTWPVPSEDDEYYSSLLTPLLGFDEYFDKDHKSIHKKVRQALLKLCEHPEIRLQVLLVTHSTSAWQELSDHTVVLKSGSVFSTGLPSKVLKPGMLQMIS